MLTTGYEQFDNHFKSFNATGHLCVLTGEAFAWMREIAIGGTKKGHVFAYFGTRLGNMATKELPGLQGQIMRGSNIDDACEYLLKNESVLQPYFNAISGSVYAAMIHSPRPVFAEDDLLACRRLARFRSIIVGCDGYMPKIKKESWDGGTKWDMHAEITKTTEYEYEVNIESHLPTHRGGFFSVKLPKPVSHIDGLTLAAVSDILYDKRLDGDFDLRPYLKRYKTITGKDRPGFMV